MLRRIYKQLVQALSRAQQHTAGLKRVRHTSRRCDATTVITKDRLVLTRALVVTGRRRRRQRNTDYETAHGRVGTSTGGSRLQSMTGFWRTLERATGGR